jgi:hypothetical protein
MEAKLRERWEAKLRERWEAKLIERWEAKLGLSWQEWVLKFVELGGYAERKKWLML